MISLNSLTNFMFLSTCTKLELVEKARVSLQLKGSHSNTKFQNPRRKPLQEKGPRKDMIHIS